MSPSDKIRERQKQYREINKEKSRVYQREYQRKYRANNPEKMKSLYKKRYKDNPKYHIESCKKWRENNPEKTNECQRKYGKYKRATDPAFCIAANLRSRLHKVLKSQMAKKSDNSFSLVGCSPSDLKIYLEGKWQSGMSWDNYKHNGWHIDHIRPCSSFNLLDAEEQKKCFHYTNLQPLWAKDNLSKSDKY